MKIVVELTGEIEEWHTKNAFKSFEVNTLDEYENTVEKYGMNIDGLNSELFKLLGKPFEKKTASFSTFFVFIVQKIESFINLISVYLRGIYDFDGKIFLETRDFLINISNIVMKQCREENFELYSLACLSNDLLKLQGLSSYILTYIQKLTETNFTFEINVAQIFSQAKTEIDTKIHADFPASLAFHLSNWVSVKWMEKKTLTEPRSFVQELGLFLTSTLRKIMDVNYTVGVSLAYLSFREINKTLSDVLVHQVKNFNILDISILDIDLKYLSKIAEEQFFELDRLKEALSQMTQFTSMFLLSNPLDYLDPNKRNEKFYSLGSVFLLKVLPKYKKKVVDGLPVVRKRECKAVTDYIEKQMKEAGSK